MSELETETEITATELKLNFIGKMIIAFSVIVYLLSIFVEQSQKLGDLAFFFCVFSIFIGLLLIIIDFLRQY